VGLAHLFKVNGTMPALNIGRGLAQMSGTNIFQAVGLGAALSAFDRGVVGKALNKVLFPLCLECAHMHFMCFAGAFHNCSVSFDVRDNFRRNGGEPAGKKAKTAVSQTPFAKHR
jgi:hypothetical protein